MFDYRQELQRRIAQFLGILQKMHRRSHEEVCGNCFVIFQERPPKGSADHRELEEAAAPSLELILAGFNDVAMASAPSGDSPRFDLPKLEESQANAHSRFIQFAFERNWFCLDMPLQTLYRDEAELILQERKGFFFLRDRPEFTLRGECVDGFDPFRKIYIYGDESSAARDMAFIFFQVWKFPVDWRFYVTAASFGSGKTDWERGTPLE